MNKTTEQLADALRAVLPFAERDVGELLDLVRDDDSEAEADTASESLWAARNALASYDAQQAKAQEQDVAAGAWSANAGSVWDHTGKWIADCNREHAARIVQCVNAHDALVSALRGCVERLGVVIESDTDDALHGASPDDVAAYDAARAALEAAGSPNA